MLKILVQLVVLLVLLCGCIFATELIPSGKYILDGSKDFVLVAGQGIEFHLYDEEEERKTWFEKQYKYSILRDSRIQPYPMTSIDAGIGIGRYSWYLREGLIVREYPTKREVSVFKIDPSKCGSGTCPVP